jgi:hypothetical protein
MTAGQKSSSCQNRLVPVISEIKGDLRYIRDVITISETKGAYIPFKQMYRHAPRRPRRSSPPRTTSDSGSTVRVPQARQRRPSIPTTIWLRPPRASAVVCSVSTRMTSSFPPPASFTRTVSGTPATCLSESALPSS